MTKYGLSDSDDSSSNFNQSNSSSNHNFNKTPGLMTDSNDNLYSFLEIDRNATSKEIASAIRKKSREFHPDKNKDPSAPKKILRVQKCKDILLNPAAKLLYDSSDKDHRNGFPKNKFYPSFHSFSTENKFLYFSTFLSTERYFVSIEV